MYEMMVPDSEVIGEYFRIRCVRDLQSKRIFSYMTEAGSLSTYMYPESWDKALRHLIRHARWVREKEEGQNQNDTLFLTVHIGTHSRFYELPGGEVQAKVWEPAGSRYYVLADDEADVWQLWNQLRDAALKQGKPVSQAASTPTRQTRGRYLNGAVLRRYYRKIEEDWSTEVAVGNFYVNFMRKIFDDNWGIDHPTGTSEPIMSSDMDEVDLGSTALALKAVDFNYYLNFKVMVAVYMKILATASTARLDTFISCAMSDAFTRKDLFAFMRVYPLESDPDQNEERNRSCTGAMTTLNSEKHAIVCFIGSEDIRNPASVWDDSLELATNQALVACAESNHEPEKPLYIVVHADTQLRFYELPDGSTTVRDWAPAHGRAYELADNEEEVWRLWVKMRDLTLQIRSDPRSL
ncbi:hypothetical protein NLG97_g1752 [Lecanicillium saksenae]|uniref:Uncharacterized protein n=1 Tax=Lecanicillium saksenae TaxID=468837 RepID=A0ACC1R2W7_9HYPO|nr:hypothetical protein NLG97_g1752 [Lecanicillium saksenae]